MKFYFFDLLSVLSFSFFVACSTNSKPKDNSRAPASIREVATYINKEVAVQKRPRINFLKEFKNNPKKFQKNTGIDIKTGKNSKEFRSDTNFDGKVDLITSFRGGRKVSVKIDRNSDGRFDRIESIKKGIKVVKYDNDFDGKIDFVKKIKELPNNRVQILESDVKKRVNSSYQLISSISESSDSEGKFCGDCEERFRRHVRDLRSEDTQEAISDEWFEKELEDYQFYKKPEGYSLKYFQLEDSLWVSESCAKEGEPFLFLVSDAINDYFDCMKNWGKTGDPNTEFGKSKSRNSNKYLHGLVDSLTDPKNPLKVHCSPPKKGAGGWGFALDNEENPSNLPDKDAKGGIGVDLDNWEDKSYIDKKSLILHEITHLFGGSHGDDQVEPFDSCSMLCLSQNSTRSEKDKVPNSWKDLEPQLKRTCFADSELKRDGSTNLNPKPYSYLNDILDIYISKGGGHGMAELGNLLIREIFYNNKKGQIHIQTLPFADRKSIARKYLTSLKNINLDEAQDYVNSFKANDPLKGKGDDARFILAALILDNSPITREKMLNYKNRAETALFGKERIIELVDIMLEYL